METATKSLENDHIQILRLIDVMEQAIQNAEADASNLQMMVDLIKNYADGYHHAKEENLFFPLMAKYGFSPDHGPVAVMLHEHVLGRNYVKGMAENLENYKNGDSKSLNSIYTNMHGYIELLRSHIAKENTILFKMADNAFSEEDHKTLLQQFKQIETNGIQGGTVNDFMDKINSLSKNYNL